MISVKNDPLFIEFIPNTTTINKDRKYYKSEKRQAFCKVDNDRLRGYKEIDFLKELKGIDYVPKFLEASDFYNHIEIFTELIPDSYISLESCGYVLSLIDKLWIISELSKMIIDLLSRNIVHGDLNESNILYNMTDRKLKIIDFGEFSSKLIYEEDRYQSYDINGERGGLLHIMQFFKFL